MQLNVNEFPNVMLMPHRTISVPRGTSGHVANNAEASVAKLQPPLWRSPSTCASYWDRTHRAVGILHITPPPLLHVARPRRFGFGAHVAPVQEGLSRFGLAFPVCLLSVRV